MNKKNDSLNKLENILPTASNEKDTNGSEKLTNLLAQTIHSFQLVEDEKLSLQEILFSISNLYLICLKPFIDVAVEEGMYKNDSEFMERTQEYLDVLADSFNDRHQIDIFAMEAALNEVLTQLAEKNIAVRK